MRWRLLVGDKAPGREQMAFDAFLLAGVEAGLSPPTLRLYGWSRPCVTLGHHQEFRRELDEAALSRLGWDWAFRATGGRAVLHDDEITYAVIAGVDAAPWSASMAQATRAIAQALVAAMGLADAMAVAGDAPGSPRPPQGTSGASRPSRLCFASKSRDEIAYRGRKLVGSAQRRLRRAFLQHGSLPLTGSQLRLLSAQPAATGVRIPERAEDGAVDTNWSEALGRPLPFLEARRRLAEGFADALGVEAYPDVLSAAEAEAWRQWRGEADKPDTAKILLREAANPPEAGTRAAAHA